MLDFEPTDLEGEPRDRTTQVRHGRSLGVLIEQAATRLGVDKSVFVRAAIAKEAGRVNEESSRHVMSADDAALFAAALDAPPAPTPRAVAGAAAYRRRVVHAE